MENASKALVMAGGVLIGIMIMSLAVYLFIDFGSTSAEINTQNAQKQLTQFNAQFTSYEGKKGLTVYDIITVAGYANENNLYYKDSLDENKITVSLKGSDIQDKLNKKYEWISKYTNSDGTLANFECEISYNENGRVKNVNFY